MIMIEVLCMKEKVLSSISIILTLVGILFSSDTLLKEHGEPILFSVKAVDTMRSSNVDLTPNMPLLTEKENEVNLQEKINMHIDLNKASEKKYLDNGKEEFTSTDYIEVAIDLENPNVLSNIPKEEAIKLLTSNKKRWTIISNHGYKYDVTYTGKSLLFKGDSDVTSFTVTSRGVNYVFYYDEENNVWILDYPTVEVGIGLNKIAYKDLKTAMEVVKKGEVITLLEDQEITKTLKIKEAFTLEGCTHKITMANGNLFDLSDITYEKSDELILKNIELDVKNFFHFGKSKFKNVKLDNITGQVLGEKTDKEIKGLFNYTNILQRF